MDNETRLLNALKTIRSWVPSYPPNNPGGTIDQWALIKIDILLQDLGVKSDANIINGLKSALQAIRRIVPKQDYGSIFVAGTSDKKLIAVDKILRLLEGDIYET